MSGKHSFLRLSITNRVRIKNSHPYSSISKHGGFVSEQKTKAGLTDVKYRKRMTMGRLGLSNDEVTLSYISLHLAAAGQQEGDPRRGHSANTPTLAPPCRRLPCCNMPTRAMSPSERLRSSGGQKPRRRNRKWSGAPQHPTIAFSIRAPAFGLRQAARVSCGQLRCRGLLLPRPAQLSPWRWPPPGRATYRLARHPGRSPAH